MFTLQGYILKFFSLMVVVMCVYSTNFMYLHVDTHVGKFDR